MLQSTAVVPMNIYGVLFTIAFYEFIKCVVSYVFQPSRPGTFAPIVYGKVYIESESEEEEEDVLKVQLLDDSTKEFYQNRMNHETDSGFDLHLPTDVTIAPHTTELVGMGLKCQPGYEDNYGYYLYPRSSIYKTGLIMHNSVGIIDYDYRGEIKAALHNLTDKPVTLERGQRVAQLCMSSLEKFKVEFVDSVSTTKRGEGGFGSTGTTFTQAMDQTKMTTEMNQTEDDTKEDLEDDSGDETDVDTEMDATQEPTQTEATVEGEVDTDYDDDFEDDAELDAVSTTANAEETDLVSL